MSFLFPGTVLFPIVSFPSFFTKFFPFSHSDLHCGSWRVKIGTASRNNYSPVSYSAKPKVGYFSFTLQLLQGPIFCTFYFSFFYPHQEENGPRFRPPPPRCRRRMTLRRLVAIGVYERRGKTRRAADALREGRASLSQAQAAQQV